MCCWHIKPAHITRFRNRKKEVPLTIFLILFKNNLHPDVLPGTLARREFNGKCRSSILGLYSANGHYRHFCRVFIMRFNVDDDDSETNYAEGVKNSLKKVISE